MRILVISNLFPPDIVGGYEMQCSSATEELRKRGHEVMVLTSVPRRRIEASDDHILRLLRTPDVYSPDRYGIRSPFWEFEANLLNVENIYILMDLLDRWRPDVCYLWSLVALGGAAIVSALEHLEMPWVWHLGDAVPADLSHFDGELRELGALFGRTWSGRFLACSQTVVNSVERLVSIAGRTRIVPNWIEMPVANRRDEELGKGEYRIVFSGRLHEEKGIFVLLDAVAELRARGRTDFRLEIVGTGDEAAVRSRIATLGIAEHISLRGWLPRTDLYEVLAASDLFAFPTHMNDPMPLAPLEAAALGCVPLLPRVSGVSEWLVDGVHCLKAERTPEDFATAIEWSMDHPDDLAAIARRGAGVVRESFLPESVMPIVEEELVLAARKARPEMTRIPEVYGIALLADAVLRRHALAIANRDAR
ncbi:MAG: glycosyltransferase family 4 protein [Acidimicrobiaceae bacterium]|nr:glycosyltransferase family 4 protein [Acidimicrobiaceae bacterium]